MIGRKFIPAIVFLWLLASASGLRAASEVLEQVRQTVDAVIDTLKDSGLKGETSEKKLSSLIRDRFDFRTMSQWVLGTNWGKVSEKEKKHFIELFSDLLEATYLGRIEQYSGEMVAYVGERMVGDRAEVDTLVQTRSANIPISYRLVRSGGNWLVYDVVVEDVSLVRNYRSSYGEILRKEGMEGLFSRMEEKLRELHSKKSRG